MPISTFDHLQLLVIVDLDHLARLHESHRPRESRRADVGRSLHDLVQRMSVAGRQVTSEVDASETTDIGEVAEGGVEGIIWVALLRVVEKATLENVVEADVQSMEGRRDA